MHPAIAIDGPAASGKSTVAKLIADRLGYTFINTGAMYRAVTWYMLEQGIDPADTAAVLEALSSVPLSSEGRQPLRGPVRGTRAG